MHPNDTAITVIQVHKSARVFEGDVNMSSETDLCASSPALLALFRKSVYCWFVALTWSWF